MTGIYCPGCGSQRAFHSLLHLQFKDSLNYNLLLIPSVVIIGYHWCISYINKIFKKDYKNYLYSPNFTKILLAVILLFWVFRNLDFEPYCYLSPDY